MKSTTIAAGILGFAVFMILFPLSITRISDQVDLPAFEGPTFKVLGYLLIAAGLSVFFHCSTTFIRKGKGTPAPIEPPKRLVTGGVYRISRNPIYLGYFMIFLGEWLFAGRWPLLGYAITMILLVHFMVVLHEEPVLRERFGKEYEDYCSRVPRWL